MAKRDNDKLARLISCINGSLEEISSEVRVFTDDSGKQYKVNIDGNMNVYTIDKSTNGYYVRNAANYPTGSNGYIYETVFVDLGRGPVKYTIGRHVLVSLVFNLDGYKYFRDSNGLLDEEIVCCHINGCKWDCRLENLEWGTSAQNLRQAHCVAGLDLHRAGLVTERKYGCCSGGTVVSCLSFREGIPGIKNEWIEQWCGNGNNKGKVEWGAKAIDSFIRFLVGNGYWKNVFI